MKLLALGVVLGILAVLFFKTFLILGIVVAAIVIGVWFFKEGKSDDAAPPPR